MGLRESNSPTVALEGGMEGGSGDSQKTCELGENLGE